MVDIYLDESDFLMHYGVLRRSGRYPWGSGDTPYERNKSFLGYVNEMKAQGLSDADIAKGLSEDELGQKLTSSDIRALKTIALNQNRRADAAQALRLKNKGMGNSAIAKQMGINESSVRSLLNPALADKQDVLENTASLLKEKMGDGYLMLGSGVENQLGISSTRLSTAVAALKEEGYEEHLIQIKQQFGAGKTTVKVLTPAGVKGSEIYKNLDKINTIDAFSDDGMRSDATSIKPPVNIDSKRVAVKFAEDGGTAADGVIYVRPGVDDVSLGASRYAQVRIAVDGTHYIKGMAMYKDDLPEGTDLMFNTNKSKSVGKLGALKKQGDDPENPYGSSIQRQNYYTDAKGEKKQGVMNIVNEEGSWADWSSTLSSQFLSKQSTSLATKQLDEAYSASKKDLDEISSLTNPVIKQKLLESYADGAESASVHLKAAAVKGQRTSVILPFNSMKETEVYAPNFENGTKVVLVRFPHGGTFEIPELIVNNKNIEAKKALSDERGHAVDAVGIHPKVAERLSGADFDGDTVLVIPNNDRSVKTTSPLAGLRNFDPKAAYGITRKEGVDPYNDPDNPNKISPRAKQQQMGDVSNLITDMTIKGAKPDELARAVRHSMVVIDAEKHDLDYKQSAQDNGIDALKATYQGRGSTGRLKGASTIVSRSGNATVQVDEKKLRSAAKGGPIDPETGKKVYEPTGATYEKTSEKTTAISARTGRRVTVSATGKYVPGTEQTTTTSKTVVKQQKSKPLLETDDARTLLSDNPTPMEVIYADHSNRMKDLANSARKASLQTGGLKYSPTAKQTYGAEVQSLNAKLNVALQNSPKERKAQLLASTAVKARVDANPGMDNADLKKIKAQELDRARTKIGAKKQQIEITDSEWDAIQAGAITTSKLKAIVNNTDLDALRQRAMPRTASVMTPQVKARAMAMLNGGATQAEVAKALGVPTSTLNSSLLSTGS